ncbi:MAG: heavy metal-binding domain-containing protein [Candidatus Auribacterota bacterium]|nr:heavy metal-binding domain-containing protein [Candidatus Auribacterota bacterium]
MIITNIDNVPEKKIEKVLGIVRGNVVGSKPVNESLLTSLKKAMASTIALAPRIITGEEVGLVPEDEMKQKDHAEEPITGRNILEDYSSLLTELRDTALTRMIQHADSYGADAVINVNFDITAITMRAFEVCAYGTAVKLS